MRLCILQITLAAMLCVPVAGRAEAQPPSTDPEALGLAMLQRGAQRDPAAAMAMYLEGLTAARAGRDDEARTWMTHAASFDPGFPQPHLALARLDFPAPSGLPHLWNAVLASVNTFSGQHLVLANLLVALILTGGLTAALVLLYVIARLASRVHHVLKEILSAWFPGYVASFAAAALLAMPALWKVGVLPVIMLLAGMFWWWMRESERRWTLALLGITVAAPVLLWALSPALFGPLDPFGRSQLLESSMVEGSSPVLMARMEARADEFPEDSDLQFGLGMLYKRAGRLQEAADTYANAADLGGPLAAIENNLGVIAYHQGDYDAAVAHFKESVNGKSKRAAPHYNLSQAYAKKLYFEKADEELREANRLSFRRVRDMIKQQTGGTNGTLLDEPLPASSSWSAAWAAPRHMPGLPEWMSPVFPGSLVLLPALGIPLFFLGWVVGRRVHAHLDGFACTNCDRPVCRRCLRRIQRKPYCLSCGEALLQIQSTAFSQLVLETRLRRSNRVTRFLEAAISWALPGYRAIRLGRTHLGAALAGGLIIGLAALVAGHPPVERILWLDSGRGLWWPWAPLAMVALVMAGSWWSVVRLEETIEVEASKLEEDDDEVVIDETLLSAHERAA